MEISVLLMYIWQSQVQQKSQSEAPGPQPVKVVEEDRITLKPIGPGMQTLEPEGTHHSTGTLSRATTPGFPTSPGMNTLFHMLLNFVYGKPAKVKLPT